MTELISTRADYRLFTPAPVDISKVPIQTQGEIEAAVCLSISRHQQNYMGRGPKHICAHLMSDLLLVRLQGVLTPSEQRLAQVLPNTKGRGLIKQVRTQLIEAARPTLEAMMHEATGVKVVSVHHDISTVTGEAVMLFTLAEPPHYREPRNR
jgi:uncharacterized protein YbcI